MSNNESARARVAEFLRQWALAKSNDQRCIYGILSDPQADEMAELLVADLQALIEQPEPEYEYALRHKDTLQHYLGDGRWRTEEAVRRTRDNRLWPEAWQIIRRVTVGEWEDVQ